MEVCILENYITIGDINRLRYAINKRIKDLHLLLEQNADLHSEITELIKKYDETLKKLEYIDIINKD